jgi:hypothetical protein
MDHEAELRRTATKINLAETFAFIDKLKQGITGFIRSPYPTINGLQISFRKADRLFDFETGPLMQGTHPAHYQKEKYGFLKPFTIEANGQVYNIAKGVGSAISKMADGLSTKGQLNEVEFLKNSEPAYYRAMLIQTKYMKRITEFIIGQHFSIGDSLRIAGYNEICVEELQLAFFDHYEDKTNYVFIDSLVPLTMQLFKEQLTSLLTSYALISGSLMQDEILFIKSTESDFSNLSEFYFERTIDSIDSWVELLSPRNYRDLYNLPTTPYLDPPVFSKLVYLCHSNKKYLRAAKIITESKNLPPHIEVAAVFVALETVKELIIDKHREKVKPFKDPAFASSIIKEFIDRVNLIDDEKFLNKKRVVSKLAQLNAIGNNESFTMAFELLGIDLNKEEKEFIKKRNHFLHGSIPFEDEEGEKTTMELHKIALYMHMLTGALMLKFAGYSGPIFNFWTYWAFERGEKIDSKLLFKEI